MIVAADVSNVEQLEELLRAFQDSPESALAAAIVAIVLGVLCCFLGYRLFKVVLAICSFVVGGAMSGGLVYVLFGENAALTIIAGIVGGIVIAIILVLLYYVGIFLVGAALGSVLAMAIMNNLLDEPMALVVVVSAIVFGCLALVVHRFLIIISTAALGALDVIVGTAEISGHGFDLTTLVDDPGSLMNWAEIETGVILMISGWVVLTLAGILVQYKYTGKRKKPLVSLSRRSEADD